MLYCHHNYSFGIIIRNACGPGWDLPEYSLETELENCYHFRYDQGLTFNWYEANRYCRQIHGSELLIVENSKESAWLWKIFSDPNVARSGIHKNDR